MNGIINANDTSNDSINNSIDNKKLKVERNQKLNHDQEQQEQQEQERNLPIKLNDPTIFKIPIQINQLKFEGLERTDKEFILSIIDNCRDSKTLGELQKSLSSSMEIINRLDLFKQIDVIIDTQTSSEQENLKSKSDKINLIFKVKEKKFKIQAGTEMKHNEAGLNAGGIFYNLFGKGECLEASGSLGMQNASPLAINFVKPILQWKESTKEFKKKNDDNQSREGSIHWWKTNFHNQLQNYLDGLSFKAKKWGISTLIEFALYPKNNPSADPLSIHEVSIGHDWRTIYGVEKDSSYLIKSEETIPNKNRAFISHVMTRSTRDQITFPTRGYLCRWMEELNWINSIPLIKSEFYGQIHQSMSIIPFIGNFSLFNPITFGLSGRIRHLYNPTGGRICILDRFQLGGPTSLRGFYPNSLGPKDRNDSLGGDFSFESGLQASFPISGRTREILRGHLFINGGFLTNLTATQDRIFNLLNSVNGIKGMWNASIGGGLIIKLGEQAKVELNLAFPICNEKDAKFTRGIQLGLGMEFL